MLFELDQIKKHLNLDDDFTEDDGYLCFLSDVADELVQKHIDKTFEEIVDENGDLPTPLKQAVLLIIGNFYANRESISYSPTFKLPHALEYILNMYRDYEGANI